MQTMTTPDWALQLFNKSVLKRRKFREVTALLGDVRGRRCLDVGSDNGVISYLLRQMGGAWSSADLNAQTVGAIRELVWDEVYQIDGNALPFPDSTFDHVAIIDFLEHIPDDRRFIEELHRTLKPGGTLILNVPHLKQSALRRFRGWIGQTDEKHGHLRPGYNLDSICEVLGECFSIETAHTYSKFFSELIDTLIVFAVTTLKRGGQGAKGLVVTGSDLQANKSMFRLYSLIYPVVWVFSKLDALVPASGYMLIVKATNNKGE
jgi:ubiquinone/menaquinone biosynthesis C-methylase UbiE